MHQLVLITLMVLTFTGCASHSIANPCYVPSMYLQVNEGLIDPTWEPEGQMRSQIEGLADDDLVCWYGNVDGSVTARVNATASGYDFYLFRKVGEMWDLVELTSDSTRPAELTRKYERQVRSVFEPPVIEPNRLGAWQDAISRLKNYV